MIASGKGLSPVGEATNKGATGYEGSSGAVHPRGNLFNNRNDAAAPPVKPPDDRSVSAAHRVACGNRRFHRQWVAAHR